MLGEEVRVRIAGLSDLSLRAHIPFPISDPTQPTSHSYLRLDKMSVFSAQDLSVRCLTSDRASDP